MLWALALAQAVAPTSTLPDPRDPMPVPWRDPGYNEFLWIQSPNFNQRKDLLDVDTIVIHATVIPTLERTTVAFNRESSQVSAHYTIGKDGSFVMHVSTFERAWHAGKSVDARGRENLNDFSIGIELVNLNDGQDPFPDAQINVLKNIIQGLRRRFAIKQLVSHEFVAVPRGRKSDPKNFPWHRLEDLGLPMYYGENPSQPKVEAKPSGGADPDDHGSDGE